MSSFHKGSTKTTPEVKFENGVLELRGVSIPENAVEFYRPLMSAITEYCGNPKPETTLNIYLYYFNTSSSKCLLGVFNAFEKVNKRMTKVKVNWYYDAHDEDFLDTAKDYQDLVKIDFDFIPLAAEEDEEERF